MFEVDYGSGSVLGMEGVDDVNLAGLDLSQVLFGLVLYEDQQVGGLFGSVGGHVLGLLSSAPRYEANITRCGLFFSRKTCFGFVIKTERYTAL